jgi:hypothetical protein
VQYVSPFTIGTSCDTRFTNANNGLAILGVTAVELIIDHSNDNTDTATTIHYWDYEYNNSNSKHLTVWQFQYISTISTYTLPLPINAAGLSRMGASATRFCTTAVTTASLWLGYSGSTSSEINLGYAQCVSVFVLELSSLVVVQQTSAL